MTNLVQPDPGQAPAAPEPRAAIEDLRQTLSAMSAAERRLRSRDHSRPGELTHAQIRSIAALGREREMTVGQLARSAELKPATVTVTLDHLEAAGIVQRHRSTEDRRVCNVSLTPKGWQVLERKLATWRALWEQRLAGVPDEDLETAMRVIRQVTEIYDSVTPPDDGRQSEPRT
ncbi:MAG TPA: MarR family transcriptional regulator [Solirubrobacteraceae bacterium]|jgi:DNA-binding MarR family transcriptional regulator|nr:MarR family transcriptional regulator [Solirubrobacteraceae bacterium]